METLPDYLDHGLEIVSIGLNPSLPSVRAGFYFANPRNRFWRALAASRLTTLDLAPGAHAMQRLLNEARIGFTDVVKRPSRQARDLRAADFRRDAPVLHEKLLRYGPRIAWFHGKVAYGGYLRHVHPSVKAGDWGAQDLLIGKSRVFVTPSTSPANAAYSLDTLTDWLDALADFAQQTAQSSQRATGARPTGSQ